MQSKTTLSMPHLLLVLGGIYTVQSVTFTFSFQGIPAVLRASGVNVEVIGMLHLLILPWVLKVLWSPYVERYRKRSDTIDNGRRVMLLSNVLLVCAMAVLAWGGTAGPVLTLAAMLLFIATVSATGDVAGDGLAVDQLVEKNRVWANTMQVGGGYLGILVGGGLFLIVFDAAGWAYAVSCLAICIIGATIPTYLLPKKAPQPSRTIDEQPSIKNALRRPGVRLGLLTIVMTMIGARMALGMVMPFMIDQEFDLTQLGLLVAGGGAVASLVGVCLGGVFVRYIGPGKGLVISLVLVAVSYAGFYFHATGVAENSLSLGILFVLNAIATAILFVSLYTNMMNFSAGNQPGIDFTLMQSLDLALAMIGGATAGLLIASYGYGVFFFLTTGLTIFGALMAYFILVKQGFTKLSAELI